MALSATAVRSQAQTLGFVAAGVAHLGPSERGEALDAWLAKGLAGTMRYLHRQARKRKQPALIVKTARAAVVVLENYLPPKPAAGAPGASAVRIAKYACGTDYHRSLLSRLEALAGFLRRQGATVAHPWVDSGPVPERELAQRAGLGWIGKNTMLIRPGVGSFFFIGTIFTDLDLAPDVPFETDHCGSCTRCLEECPTQALLAPRLLDATRCLSYLTIEWKGAIPANLADRGAGWAFGCDICNDVCPWNERFAAPTEREEYQRRDVPDVADPAYFDRMDHSRFDELFEDTPLARPGLERMRRNWRAAWRGLAASGTASAS